MTHAQKPDFVFRRNGRVNLKRLGASVQSTTGSRGVRIIGSNAGCTIVRGSVKGTEYPLHSPVFPSLPLTCVTVCHHVFNWALPSCRVHLPSPPLTLASNRATSIQMYCTVLPTQVKTFYSQRQEFPYSSRNSRKTSRLVLTSFPFRAAAPSNKVQYFSVLHTSVVVDCV